MSERPKVEPMAYTIAEAVAVSGVGRTKLYEEIFKSGRLKAFWHCGRRLILREDLEKWLRASRDAA
jgi:hypothetical protein